MIALQMCLDTMSLYSMFVFFQLELTSTRPEILSATEVVVLCFSLSKKMTMDSLKDKVGKCY